VRGESWSMVVKRYFLSELERETYEKDLFALFPEKMDEFLQMDDEELTKFYEQELKENH
jgi:hypothetical protein